MDTVKFLKTINRMCNNYGSSCNGCPISIEIQRDGDYLDCYGFIRFYPEKALLEIFPTVILSEDGIPIICPHDMGQIGCHTTCEECCKEFWMEEVE